MSKSSITKSFPANWRANRCINGTAKEKYIGKFEEGKHKRDEGGKFSSTGEKKAGVKDGGKKPTDGDRAGLLADFMDWSGGFRPHEMDSRDIGDFVKNATSMDGETARRILEDEARKGATEESDREEEGRAKMSGGNTGQREDLSEMDDHTAASSFLKDKHPGKE